MEIKSVGSEIYYILKCPKCKNKFPVLQRTYLLKNKNVKLYCSQDCKTKSKTTTEPLARMFSTNEDDYGTIDFTKKYNYKSVIKELNG